MAFRGGLGVGHRLQALGLYGLVDSGGGLGAGLDGDQSPVIPHLRIGLAGGGGVLWGVDGGALGHGNVEEGLDGVVLCGHLRGDGSRWGEEGSGWGGCELLALIMVRD